MPHLLISVLIVRSEDHARFPLKTLYSTASKPQAAKFDDRKWLHDGPSLNHPKSFKFMIK